ncbi:MAG: VCBS repeat-containing protein [Acidobacteria bacterium]|nr:VCBS repeat-containing protein [Acidobacteriota bacterium]
MTPRLLFLCLLFLLPLSAQSTLAPPDQDWQLRFDGSDAVVLPAGAGPNLGSSYTLQIWVYQERRNWAILAQQLLDNPDTDPFFAFRLYLDADGHIGWGQTRGTPGSQMSSTTTEVIPLRQWCHIAVTSDGSLMRVYLNGAQVRQQASPGALPVNNLPLHLGASFNPPGSRYPGFAYNSFVGILCQFGIWNRALSASEIRAAMSTRFDGKEPGLVAFWPLDDGPGYSFRNLSGSQTASLLYPTRTKLVNGNADNPVVEQYCPVWVRPALFRATPFDWSAQTQAAIEGPPSLLVPIDFDNDGDLDLVGGAFYNPNISPPTIHAWRNDGQGHFTDATKAIFGDTPIVVLSPYRGIVNDLNHDGRPDLILIDAGSDYFCCHPVPAQNRVFLQTPDGRLADETITRMPIRDRFAHDSDAADIDNDGNLDLFLADINLAAEAPWFRMTVMKNDGNGSFAIDNSRLPPSLSKRVAFSSRFLDANRDGAPDLFLGVGKGYDDLLLLNDGTGRFLDMLPGALPPKIGGPNSSSRRAVVGDLNRDGAPDLVLSVEAVSHAGFQVLLNRGDGTYEDRTLDWLPEPFVQRGSLPANHAIDSGDMFLTDFNGDGYPDLLLNRAGDFWRLYLNTGSNFANVSDYLPFLTTGAFTTGDFDGDGRADITYGQSDGAGKAMLVIGLNKRDAPAPSPATPSTAPLLGPLSVLSDSSLSPEAIAPGMRVRIRGRNLGPAEPVSAVEVPGTPLPDSLSGVSVSFDSTPARLVSVSEKEIVAIVPFAVAGQWISTVRVSYQDLASAPINVFVSPTVPMAYAAPVFFENGMAYFLADAWKVDGDSRTRISPSTPLKWGDRVAFRVTGAGQDQSPLSDNSLTETRPFQPAVPIPVRLGQFFSPAPAPLTPVSMTYAPEGLAGIVEIVVDLPPTQPDTWVQFFVPDGRRLQATVSLIWPIGFLPAPAL